MSSISKYACFPIKTLHSNSLGLFHVWKSSVTRIKENLLIVFSVLRCISPVFLCIRFSDFSGPRKVKERSEIRKSWLKFNPIKIWFWLPKQQSSRKTSISAFLTMPKPLTVWITINCGKFWKRWEYQTTWPTSWESCIQVRNQQLELDMEQQTGSK